MQLCQIFQTRSKICQRVWYRTLWFRLKNISPLTQQDFIFQLRMPFCHAEQGRWYVCSMNRGREQQNRANTQKKKEHSQRKFWLVYADSPVKILPRLLLWGLLWTLPAPLGSYQCSHVFLVWSPSAVCSLRHTGGMFFSATAVTHILISKKKCTLLQLDYSLYMIVRGRHYRGRDNQYIAL